MTVVDPIYVNGTKKAIYISGGELELWGFRGFPGAARFTDEDLAGLDAHDLTKLVLHRQDLLTRLPPLRPTLAELEVREMSLASLDGIEKQAGLQALTISRCPQLDIPREMPRICELPALRKLSLWTSATTLPSLPPNLVELNVSLDDANMDFTQVIASIAACSTLRRLTLAFTNPTDVPDALAPLTQIRELVLSEIIAVPPSLFTLRDLEGLTISGKKFTTLPPELGQLTKLRYLDLKETAFRVMPPTVGALTSLRSLRLPYRKPPKKVPEELFTLKLDAVSGWHPLDDRFQITKVEDGPVGGRLFINDVKDMPTRFGDPSSLELLLPESTNEWPQIDALVQVSHVDICVGNLADALRRLAPKEHLRSLSIRDRYERLPAELGLLTGITRLSLGNWYTPGEHPGVLAELPASIGQLVNLQTLEIRPSALTSLPDSIGNLRELTELNLGTAPLAALPRSIGRLRKLASIKLVMLPELRALPVELLECEALTKLSIHVTGLSIGALAFLGKHPALREIDVAASLEDLDSFLAAFAGSPLEVLTLRDTRNYTEAMKALPASIGGLTNLKRLDISQTQIDELPPEMAGCTALRRFMFSYLPTEKKAALKRRLPKARWKFREGRGDYWYERTDVDPWG